MPPRLPSRTSPSGLSRSGSTRVVVLVVVAAGLAVATWAVLRPPTPTPRPVLLPVVSDRTTGPTHVADLGPLADVSAEAAPAFDGRALDHVLRAIGDERIAADGDELSVSEVAALPAAGLPGRLVETWGRVRALASEAFASAVNPRWDQLWAFALDGDDGGTVIVVKPGDSRSIDAGQPAPTRRGALLSPLRDGERVRVRGVVLQRRVGSIGVLPLEAPTVVLVGRQFRRAEAERPAPASLAEIPWASVNDRLLGATRLFDDEVHWALLAWHRRVGSVVPARLIASGELPVRPWDSAEFRQWAQEMTAETSLSEPDRRTFTNGSRGKVFLLEGYLVDLREEGWDRLPDNPYGVDRRYTYWLLPHTYAHVGLLLHSAAPLADFPGVGLSRGERRQRVRAYALFVRTYSYSPAAGGEISTPAFHLLHLEAVGG